MYSKELENIDVDAVGKIPFSVIEKFLLANGFKLIERLKNKDIYLEFVATKERIVIPKSNCNYVVRVVDALKIIRDYKYPVCLIQFDLEEFSNRECIQETSDENAIATNTPLENQHG